MKREEELHHPSQRLCDDELLFRLRHIASGRCGNATVDSALEYAVADGTLTRERADALRQALVDEGVVNDQPRTEENRIVDTRALRRCKTCGYSIGSRSHFMQCLALEEKPQPKAQILSDSEALDLIAREMSCSEWSADALDVIAAYVRGTGREVGDVE